ncbi:hypothetical protein CVS40_7797 [Lucilia cuprina]|nr:hypothetical protein CVS40_7797 [Lucilia cuprina]
MKIFICLLALVAIAAGTQNVDPFASRSISSTVVEAIEDLRDQMPCGFPGMGIPPLAPLRVSHKDVNIDTPALRLSGTVDNFRLNGLNDFEIAEMKVNAITSKVTFRFIFNNVNVDTLYDLKLMLKKAGFTINMVGAGPAKFAIKDMHIWGNIKYSLGVISGKLKLKKLEVRARIGDVDSDIEGILGEGAINHKMNEVLEEAVEMAINENEDLISETIESLALPMVNGVLEEVKLSDLVGGSGGEETNMKYLLILLALMPLALAGEYEEIANAEARSISSQVVDAIEAAKEQMPCGFPGLGIPPLAPLKIAHQEIAIDNSAVQAFGEINNFRLDGLNDFDIVEFKVSPIFSRVNFKFNWNHVYFNTDYELSTARDNKGIKRSGPAKFALKDLTVWGVIKYNLGLISGKLTLKEFSVYVSLGEVKSEIGGLSKIPIINRKLNRIIEEWFMLAVNDNTNKVAELTNSMVVPIVNDMLSDMSLSDLLGMLGGGGSGESEPVPCIPPEDSDYMKYFY